MNTYSCIHMKEWNEHNKIEHVAELFKTMGDPTRLAILCHLLAGEQMVGELTMKFEMTQSAISHQLRLLRNLHLVRTRRVGRNIFYSLADQHVGDLINLAVIHAQEPASVRPRDNDNDGE